MAARGTCNWDDGEKPLEDPQAVAAARGTTLRITILSLVLAGLATALLYWIP
ncbi:MAG: hypothetical protein RMJ19_10775 [Gemmatales bacterium]|nr:hypothetical protein [Gemmatales bacterium]MCS7160942.1 hypothetical protein [Gemmatales bacterium]MDW8176145.1 hypothetical protein [Gemmatales bacterium]MDW8222889.1 hypothetical protein [Gemmatales bacterium]